MTRSVIVAGCLIASAVSSNAEDVRVFIAPQTTTVPASGKVTFDVYWTNSGSSVRTIPPKGVYTFDFDSIETVYSFSGMHSALDYHTEPERHILPHAIVHERITVDVGMHRNAQLTKVYAHFEGRRWNSKFTSNTVVLRNSRE